MTDVEKAIEILKPLIFCGGCTTAADKEISSCSECDSYKAKQLALEALKKQIPKKCIAETIYCGTDISGECDVANNYLCSVCKMVVGNFEAKEHFYKFCPECRQALCWNEEKDEQNIDERKKTHSMCAQTFPEFLTKSFCFLKKIHSQYFQIFEAVERLKAITSPAFAKKIINAISQYSQFNLIETIEIIDKICPLIIMGASESEILKAIEKGSFEIDDNENRED